MASTFDSDRAASCPDCGAPRVDGRAGCQRLFDEVLAREYGDFRYARLHRMTVDAYALQHPSEYMRSAKSYAAHLTGLYGAFESGDAAGTNTTVQHWLNGATLFERPGEPAARQRGALTIVHVHGATDLEDYLRRVREWALATWDGWRDYHSVARQWVDQAGASRGAGTSEPAPPPASKAQRSGSSARRRGSRR